MEKLVYLLWKPDDTADNVWHQQLTQTLIPALRIAGAHRFRLNLADAAHRKYLSEQVESC